MGRFPAATGLGLAIVKKPAAVYGGEVGVVSEPGAGSAFTATLYDAPLASETLPEPAAVPAL